MQLNIFKENKYTHKIFKVLSSHPIEIILFNPINYYNKDLVLIQINYRRPKQALILVHPLNRPQLKSIILKLINM